MIPRIRKSSTGRTTASSAIAWPFSVLTRNVRRTSVIPSFLRNEVGRSAKNQSAPPRLNMVALLLGENADHLVDRARDRPGKVAEDQDQSDGNNAQHDAVLRHRLAVLLDEPLAERDGQRLQIRKKLEHFRSHLPRAIRWLEHAVFIDARANRPLPPLRDSAESSPFRCESGWSTRRLGE